MTENPVRDIYFRKALEICLNDPNSDGTLIIYAPQEITNASISAQIVAETAKQTKKFSAFGGWRHTGI
jgi:acyl-CoA synthetase (NDP forming)